MQEWFKARNSWGAGIETLSDAEAGRLAKAIWAYTMRGEQQDISGAERALFALILATLEQDEQKTADISQKRAAAGALGGKQSQANASKSKQTEANEANAPNKSKNKNKETDIEKENKRFIPPTVDEVAEYCRERHNKVNPQRFVSWYEANGWKVGKNPMRNWKAAVRTWEDDTSYKDGQPKKSKYECIENLSAAEEEARRKRYADVLVNGVPLGEK